MAHSVDCEVKVSCFFVVRLRSDQYDSQTSKRPKSADDSEDTEVERRPKAPRLESESERDAKPTTDEAAKLQNGQTARIMLENVLAASFWKAICPGLHISDSTNAAKAIAAFCAPSASRAAGSHLFSLFSSGNIDNTFRCFVCSNVRVALADARGRLFPGLSHSSSLTANADFSALC